MRSAVPPLSSLLVGLVAAVFLFHSAPTASAAEVTVLDDSNFEHQTQASTGQTTGKWFVEFYAPWCGHCKKLAPIWESLADKLSEENPSDGLVVAKVDVTSNHELGDRFSIRGYPTLLLFAERRMFRYKGPRDLESLAEFAAGGYKDVAAGEKVPPPPGLVEVYGKKLRQLVRKNEFARVTAEDFGHILEFRKNAAAVLLLMGFIAGLMSGCVLGSAGSKGGKKKREGEGTEAAEAEGGAKPKKE